MKLTKETLKRIIKEELDKVVNEQELDEGLFDFFRGKKKEEPPQAPVEKKRPVLELINNAKNGSIGLEQKYQDVFRRAINGIFLDQNNKLLIDPETEDDPDYQFAQRMVRSIGRWASKKAAYFNRSSRRSMPQQVEQWEQTDHMKLGYGANRNPTYEQANREAKVMWEKLKKVKEKYKQQ